MTKKYLSRYFKYAAVLFVFISYVEISYALVISEIHPKPTLPLTDPKVQSGREWIEVFNDTPNTISLVGYDLYDGSDKNPISTTGDANIASGEYFIIGQDLTKFQSDPDNSTYTGKFFKATFSALTDSGEVLTLKKGASTIYTIDYKPYTSGISYGQSLNFDGTTYKLGTATPGSGSLTVNPNATSVVDTTASTTATSTNTTSNSTTTQEIFIQPTYYYRSYFPESEKIYTNVGANKIGISGADILFTASAVTGDKRQLNNAAFFWNFGDGESGEGKSVSHVYKFAGEYTVDVEAYSEGRYDESRLFVKIVDPELKIKIKDHLTEKVVQVENTGKEVVDIGGFLIKTSGGEYEYLTTLGKHLSILPGKSILLSQGTLKFATSTTYASLSYANGRKISEFEIDNKKANKNEKSKIIIKKEISTTTPLITGVYTKQAYEKIKSEITVTATTSKISKAKQLSQKPVVPKLLSTNLQTEVVTEMAVPENKFVIDGGKPSVFDSLWGYFR